MLKYENFYCYVKSQLIDLFSSGPSLTLVKRRTISMNSLKRAPTREPKDGFVVETYAMEKWSGGSRTDRQLRIQEPNGSLIFLRRRTSSLPELCDDPVRERCLDVWLVTNGRFALVCMHNSAQNPGVRPKATLDFMQQGKDGE